MKNRNALLFILFVSAPFFSGCRLSSAVGALESVETPSDLPRGAKRQIICDAEADTLVSALKQSLGIDPKSRLNTLNADLLACFGLAADKGPYVCSSKAFDPHKYEQMTADRSNAAALEAFAAGFRLLDKVRGRSWPKIQVTSPKSCRVWQLTQAFKINCSLQAIKDRPSECGAAHAATDGLASLCTLYVVPIEKGATDGADCRNFRDRDPGIYDVQWEDLKNG